MEYIFQGHCRKGDWCTVPSAFGYALGGECHRCAECGSWQDASRKEYALASYAHHGGLWHYSRHYHTVHGKLGRRHLHRRSECHHLRRAIFALLHLGHRIGRYSLLFQRILLRMRGLHHFVHSQLLFHRTGSYPVQLSLFNQLSRHALPDGHCHAYRFPRFGHHLRGILSILLRETIVPIC